MLTKTHDTIRYIVFKEEDTWYAVALELGIVVDGGDPEVALFSLFDAISGVLEIENKPEFKGKRFHTPEVDPEYEAIWNQGAEGKGAVKSPLQIYTTGLRQVA